MNYTHLLYVWEYDIRCNDYVFRVYGVKTRDVFHTMGEMHFRSIKHLKGMTFVKLNDENRQAKLDYWKKENVPIIEYYNKFSYQS